MKDSPKEEYLPSHRVCQRDEVSPGPKKRGGATKKGKKREFRVVFFNWPYSGKESIFPLEKKAAGATAIEHVDGRHPSHTRKGL